MKEIEKLRLMKSRVLVKPVPVKARSIIISTSEDLPSDVEAEVINIAHNVDVCKVGDVIRTSKYAGTEYEFEGETYRFIYQTDVSLIYDANYEVGARAVLDRIIIDADKVTRETPSGIIIPDVALEKRRTGIIVNLGGYDADGSEINLIPGDRVMYPSDGGIDFKGVDGKIYYIFRYDDLMLKFLDK